MRNIHENLIYMAGVVQNGFAGQTMLSVLNSCCYRVLQVG